MPAIYFKKKWKKKLLYGDKCQTIRPSRKKKLKIGDKLKIYLGERFKTKKFELLGEAEITDVFEVIFHFAKHESIPIAFVMTIPDCKHLQTETLKKIAIKDGFETEEELIDWFVALYKLDKPKAFDVIRFKPLKENA